MSIKHVSITPVRQKKLTINFQTASGIQKNARQPNNTASEIPRASNSRCSRTDGETNSSATLSVSKKTRYIATGKTIIVLFFA